MKLFERFFALSPELKKSAGSGRQCGDPPVGGVSTLGSHQMARARVAAHSSSSTPAAYVPEEWVDEYGRTWQATAGLLRRWWLLGHGLAVAAAVGEGGRVFKVFSHDKVLQRFVVQIFGDFLGLDRVQQRASWSRSTWREFGGARSQT